MCRGSENDALTINTDIYPTILELAGLPLNPAQHLDGVSIKDALTGEAELPERSLFWAYNYDHNELGHKASVAIREGRHKLIYWLGSGHTELYDLEADVAEEHDLSQQEPALVASLLEDIKQVDFMQKYLEP